MIKLVKRKYKRIKLNIYLYYVKYLCNDGSTKQFSCCSNCDSRFSWNCKKYLNKFK
jgi:hypothetical protein